MRGFLIRAVVVALGLWLASQIVPGVEIRSTSSLIAAALLLGIVNAIVRPILVILTLPITLLTLGLFLLVINGLMIELVAHVLDGFFVAGLGSAILTSIVVAVVSWLMSGFVGPQGRIEMVTVHRYERL
ncbi:MAG: phage holin family protein [Bradyrhizobium sp.]|nr:MAG: phage holin family protein [Bradyrhizobium sp.]